MEYRDLEVGDILEAGDVYTTFHLSKIKQVDEDLYGMEIDEDTVYTYKRPLPSEAKEEVGCDHVIGLAPDDRGDLFEVYSSSLIDECNLDTKYKYCRDCGVRL